MEVYWAFVIFISGLLLGSFGNVVIYRLPKDLSVVRPRSHCYKCNKMVAWFDNIPVFSWFILGGKCRNCKAPFSFRYPFVEFLTGIVFLALYLHLGLSWTLLEYSLFAYCLIIVSFIDLDHMILPDEFTLSGIVIGLVGAALNPERDFMPALWGVLLGGGFLWAVAVIYQALRKQEGMGGGDIKLLAWMGAVLGWTSIPFIILTSSVLGTFIGVFQMMKAKSNSEGLSTAIPFGPFLALAAIIYIFGGKSITEWYFGLFIPSIGPVH